MAKPSLRIAVNTRLLLRNKLEGIGWFTYETLRRMVASHPEATFYFLFDRDPDPKYLFASNVKPVVLHPQARHPVLFYLWFEWAVPSALRSIRPDIFLSPDGYLSLRTDVPSLAVIHDLNFEHYPEDLPFLQRWYYRHFFPRFAKKAARIVTVSAFSKKDIVSQYGVSAEKVDVVYNGANDLFAPIEADLAEKIRTKYTGGRPYFLFVGSLHPRKNLARLFAAFDQFKEQDRQEIRLLVVGERKWWTAEIANAFEAMKHKGEVVFTGRLQAADLQHITGAALASVYVSYFEGFGIPILEAFRCGTPVITADATATAEIGADAAVLVDPFNVEAIAEAMTRMAIDDGLRKACIEAGLRRSGQFSWDAAAAELWRSIEFCLEGASAVTIENQGK